MTIACRACGSEDTVNLDWFDEEIVFTCRACAAENRLGAEDVLRLTDEAKGRKGG